MDPPGIYPGKDRPRVVRGSGECPVMPDYEKVNVQQWEYVPENQYTPKSILFQLEYVPAREFLRFY